jgi:hypothetical protein
VSLKLGLSDNGSFRTTFLILEIIHPTGGGIESIMRRRLNFMKSTFSEMHPIPMKSGCDPSPQIDIVFIHFSEKLRFSPNSYMFPIICTWDMKINEMDVSLVET